MKLWSRLLIGLPAAVALLPAQDFPVVVDIDKIQTTVRDEMKRAQVELEFHKDVLAEIPQKMLLAKEAMAWSIGKAMDHAAFAMPTPFLQGGKPGDGRLTEDEELKAMAIDSLMHSDSERAIPVIDKLLQNPQTSLRLRMRALQALGRSNSAKAQEVVTRVAKDGSNPELQSRALRMLGSRDGAQNSALLGEIFASASNVDIKRQVLRSWASMGAKDKIVSVAKSDSNPEVRESAINHLSGMRANTELAALYGSETSTEVRERILRALAGAGDWQKLLEIAKSEKNEELRDRAIRSAGSVRAAGVSEGLAALYSSSADTATRNAILRALSNQGDAKQLIALARKETNPELKRSALQSLSRMKGDEVTTFLTELLAK